MNPEAAEHVAAQLRERFPGADICVTPQATGLHLHMRTASGSMQASIGDGPSAILAALGTYAPGPAEKAAP